MKKFLYFLLAAALIICVVPFAALQTSAADRVSVTNPNNVTGEDIVAEARSWAGTTAKYWSASSPWPTCIAWRTGFTVEGQTSFDCCGFISRVLNDLGFRGEKIVANYSCVLRTEYGAYFIDSTIAGICNYGTDITNAVLKAKNGDYSELKAGDIIGWLGDASLANHIIIYAGLNSAGQPTMVEFTGNGYMDRVITASYQKAFQFGARLTENETRDYADIEDGVYYLKNSNGKYMAPEGEEGDGVNVLTLPFALSDNFAISFEKSDKGYILRPLNCENSVINNYGYTVADGNNVTLWETTDHPSQKWYFEKLNNGYAIRSVMNPACCIAADAEGNAVIKTYSGAPEQIWQIENVIVYDANIGEEPVFGYKQYGEEYAFNANVANRIGYKLLGWSHSADAEEPEIKNGDAYNQNENLYLYSVWEKINAFGDVNADGEINQYDYILVKRHYFKTRVLTEDEMARADVNNDNTVNQYDYILISRHYFGTYVINGAD